VAGQVAFSAGEKSRAGGEAYEKPERDRPASRRIVILVTLAGLGLSPRDVVGKVAHPARDVARALLEGARASDLNVV
jgi:hypothetical protein